MHAATMSAHLADPPARARSFCSHPAPPLYAAKASRQRSSSLAAQPKLLWRRKSYSESALRAQLGSVGQPVFEGHLRTFDREDL